MIYHEFAFSWIFFFLRVIVAHSLPPRRWPPMCCEPKTETDFFLRLHLYANVRINFFLRVFILVLTGSYPFAQWIYRTSILQLLQNRSKCCAHIPFKLLCTLAMLWAVRRITYSLNESLCRITAWQQRWRRRWTIGRAERERKMDYVNCVLGALASIERRKKKWKNKASVAIVSHFYFRSRCTRYTVKRVRCARLPCFFFRSFAYEFIMKNSRFNFYLHAQKKRDHFFFAFKYTQKLWSDFFFPFFHFPFFFLVCAVQFVCSCIN